MLIEIDETDLTVLCDAARYYVAHKHQQIADYRRDYGGLPFAVDSRKRFEEEIDMVNKALEKLASGVVNTEMFKLVFSK